jgi:hypothetical protein
MNVRVTREARWAMRERARIAGAMRPDLPDGPGVPGRTGGAMTEDELLQGYAGAARTAQDARQHQERPRVPVDWDLAVGEPLARREGGTE